MYVESPQQALVFAGFGVGIGYCNVGVVCSLVATSSNDEDLVSCEAQASSERSSARSTAHHDVIVGIESSNRLASARKRVLPAFRGNDPRPEYHRLASGPNFVEMHVL